MVNNLLEVRDKKSKHQIWNFIKRKEKKIYKF